MVKLHQKTGSLKLSVNKRNVVLIQFQNIQFLYFKRMFTDLTERNTLSKVLTIVYNTQIKEICCKSAVYRNVTPHSVDTVTRK